ncbi:MAG TPA: DUF167 domain-containing protein [Candidatus Paceibacterota bacterium]
MSDTRKQYRVHVTTNSRREYLKEKKEEVLEVAVREKPKEGRANERVRELVADFCRVPVKNVRIIKGAYSSGKIVLVYDTNQH